MADSHTRLNEIMDARRRELGRRWKDVADDAGVSEETIRLIRRGKRDDAVRATETEGKIERALHWMRGSIQVIRDGGEPRSLPGAPRSMAPARPPMDAWAWHMTGGRVRYPSFVGDDPSFQTIWDIPDELLPAEERKYAILQIKLLREMANPIR